MALRIKHSWLARSLAAEALPPGYWRPGGCAATPDTLVSNILQDEGDGVSRSFQRTIPTRVALQHW
jgi:hypothetical protein